MYGAKLNRLKSRILRGISLQVQRIFWGSSFPVKSSQRCWLATYLDAVPETKHKSIQSDHVFKSNHHGKLKSRNLKPQTKETYNKQQHRTHTPISNQKFNLSTTTQPLVAGVAPRRQDTYPRAASCIGAAFQLQ